MHSNYKQCVCVAAWKHINYADHSCVNFDKITNSLHYIRNCESGMRLHFIRDIFHNHELPLSLLSPLTTSSLSFPSAICVSLMIK